ncbi:MAG: hypothetical protein HEEMFOPI_01214 [Holosporales bacterium]
MCRTCSYCQGDLTKRSKNTPTFNDVFTDHKVTMQRLKCNNCGKEELLTVITLLNGVQLAELIKIHNISLSKDKKDDLMSVKWHLWCGNIDKDQEKLDEIIVNVDEKYKDKIIDYNDYQHLRWLREGLNPLIKFYTLEDQDLSIEKL